MKALSYLILILLSAVFASAQISVEVQLDQDQYLPNESLVAKVRITNRSGQSLKMGTTPDWLTFSIGSRENPVVPQIADPDVVRPFTSESGTTVTRRVDLSPYYNLTKSGRFELSAAVKVAEWGQIFVSKPVVFEVKPGSKFWEMVFGMPAAPDQKQPEIRKYILQKTVSLKSMTLYFRLTDRDETRNFRVYPIAPMVSFSKPEAQLDPESNLHVLHQTGARSFNYSVISPEGNMTLRQTFDYTTTRPILKPDKDGKIGVAGGIRHVGPTDYPPVETVTENTNAKPANP
jgi:hypothetical protein